MKLFYLLRVEKVNIVMRFIKIKLKDKFLMINLYDIQLFEVGNNIGTLTMSSGHQIVVENEDLEKLTEVLNRIL